MAEYIEREATCKDCLHVNVCIFRDSSEDEKICRQFKPTADVVEVVRCKDCLYNENGNCMKSEFYTFDYRPDYYCADGERGGGATDKNVGGKNVPDNNVGKMDGKDDTSE